MEAHPQYLFDTNVLIDAYKHKKRLKGFTTAVNAVEFPLVVKMKGINIIYPQPRDYKLAAKTMSSLLSEGAPVPATDLIIAAVASNRGLTVITRDAHFRKIAKHMPLHVEVID